MISVEEPPSTMIVSASRRTDLPAFFPEWTIKLINEMDRAFFTVFWTKDPEPILPYLKNLKTDFYFQYTLNYYPEYEPNIPHFDKRVETFKKLSEKYGKDRVIWRFDPILVSNSMSVYEVISRIFMVGSIIYPYTNKLVFSFIDKYWKQSFPDGIRPLTKSEMYDVENALVSFNKTWNIELRTCAELLNLEGKIFSNRCIDTNLIEKLTGTKIKYVKDFQQRYTCDCHRSYDIGSYNTCKHGCVYCYANK